MDDSPHTVCVIGLGRMGLPVAHIWQRRGLRVVGVERDAEVRRRIEVGDFGYFEPGIEPEASIDVLASLDEVPARQIDVWYVAVGTERDGGLDSKPAVDAAVQVGASARRGALLLIESTLEPGTIAGLVEELRRRGRRVGEDLSLAYCPERAAPGAIVGDVAKIPRLVAGVTDRCGARAHAALARLTDAPLVRCEPIEAELSKIAENAQRDVAIAFANELADLSRSYGASVRRVEELVRSHPRGLLLSSGMGVGGICLPKAGRWFADHGASTSAAARVVNDSAPWNRAGLVRGAVQPPALVAVLGLGYKPGAFDERRRPTPADLFVDGLRQLGFEARAWDPAQTRSSVDEVLEGADAIAFGCAHDVFRSWSATEVARMTRARLVFDFVGAIDANQWRAAGWDVRT